MNRRSSNSDLFFLYLKKKNKLNVGQLDRKKEQSCLLTFSVLEKIKGSIFKTKQTSIDMKITKKFILFYLFAVHF